MPIPVSDTSAPRVGPSRAGNSPVESQVRIVILPAPGGELGGVLDEVPEDLLQPRGVALHVVIAGARGPVPARGRIPRSPRDRPRPRARSRDARRPRPGRASAARTWPGSGRAGRRSAGPRARRCDGSSPASIAPPASGRACSRRSETAEQDRGQRGAELVAEHREEPVLRAAGGLRRLLGDLQLLVMRRRSVMSRKATTAPRSLAVGVPQRPCLRLDPAHLVGPRPPDDQLQVVELFAPQGAAERSVDPRLAGADPRSRRRRIDPCRAIPRATPNRSRSRRAPAPRD